MRRLVFLLVLIITSSGCKKEPEIKYDYVSARFKEFSGKIQKVQYDTHTIDTFAQGAVWNHKGFALIERDEGDKTFGFSFYGRRLDVQNEYLYDNGNGFTISSQNKSYRIETGNPGFLGSPGGQMICRDIFFLDTAYRTFKAIERGDKYLLTFEFEDDTTYDVTNSVKILELNRSNFFPTKITRSYEVLGNKAVHQILLSNVKINKEVEKSIANHKNQFADFEIIAENSPEKNRILNTKLSGINLPDVLQGVNNAIKFGPDKVTLIDFWEVWCGPCIKSLPEVEKLRSTYKDRLQVIGVVTEDKETAIKLIGKKGITFLNLFADKDYLRKFSVNSYPRYFLIDNKGVVQQEYFGFSEQIEADIKSMMAK